MNTSSLATIHEWLSRAIHELLQAGLRTARLDALVLLEDQLNTNRAQLLAHPEMVIKAGDLSVLNRHLQRRLQHEPLAYIRNKTEFYGRNFALNNKVLEPRPESEIMIDLLKKTCPNIEYIADVGTGSGALAITAKLELPQAEVIGIDIATECIAVARRNAKLLNAQVEFIQGDLLLPLNHAKAGRRSTALLCNLPYVPDNFTINPAAMNEPKAAIFGGPDGMDLYKQLFAQLATSRLKPDFIFTESMPPQHQNLLEIAQTHKATFVTSDDFIQVFSFSNKN